jgi:hypothetical protein
MENGNARFQRVVWFGMRNVTTGLEKRETGDRLAILFGLNECWNAALQKNDLIVRDVGFRLFTEE